MKEGGWGGGKGGRGRREEGEGGRRGREEGGGRRGSGEEGGGEGERGLVNKTEDLCRQVMLIVSSSLFLCFCCCLLGSYIQAE